MAAALKPLPQLQLNENGDRVLLLEADDRKPCLRTLGPEASICNKIGGGVGGISEGGDGAGRNRGVDTCMTSLKQLVRSS